MQDQAGSRFPMHPKWSNFGGKLTVTLIHLLCFDMLDRFKNVSIFGDTVLKMPICHKRDL